MYIKRYDDKGIVAWDKLTSSPKILQCNAMEGSPQGYDSSIRPILSSSSSPAPNAI